MCESAVQLSARAFGLLALTNDGVITLARHSRHATQAPALFGTVSVLAWLRVCKIPTQKTFHPQPQAASVSFRFAKISGQADRQQLPGPAVLLRPWDLRIQQNTLAVYYLSSTALSESYILQASHLGRSHRSHLQALLRDVKAHRSLCALRARTLQAGKCRGCLSTETLHSTQRLRHLRSLLRIGFHNICTQRGIIHFRLCAHSHVAKEQQQQGRKEAKQERQACHLSCPFTGLGQCDTHTVQQGV